MIREYITPSGEYPRIYGDMLKQVHLLIAGASGSGKSTVVNGIMRAALYQSPAAVRFILIDPKGTELSEYERLPHVIQYAQSMPDCIAALKSALQLTKTRFADMKRRGLREYNGSHVYLIIDELMFLMNRPQYKRDAMNILQDILVIARAARVHVIACTQSPTAATGLPVNLRCNFDSRLALRTSTAQDSRNIIGIRGCESFPNPTLTGKAYGYYMHGGEMELYLIPQDNPTDRQRLIEYWTGTAGRGKLILFA